MREASVSLLGMLNYDDTVLDSLTFPEGLDGDVLKDNLVAETAELELLYSSPFVLKSLIGIWSRKQNPVWEKLYATTQLEYDPIENYNRYEEVTEDTTGTKSAEEQHRGTDQVAGTSSHTATDSGTDTTTGSRDTEHKVAGFNSATAVLQSKDEESSSGSLTHGKTTTETGSTSETTTYGKTITDSAEETGNLERQGHMHGNIGVTTTQQMIEQEREIDKFNIYDYIIQEFKQRFCVLVY